MNDELRHRTLELNDMNRFLETVLMMTGNAVVVVDRQHNVRIWNGEARELWGLTPDEAQDQNLFSLDIGLPVGELKPALNAILSGDSEREEVVLTATNRRGRQFQCRVTTLPLAPLSDDGATGAIMLMEGVAS